TRAPCKEQKKYTAMTPKPVKSAVGPRDPSSSLPGLTRQSILSEVLLSMDARVKPEHDEWNKGRVPERPCRRRSIPRCGRLMPRHCCSAISAARSRSD